MSSLAATKADGFWIPNDYDPAKGVQTAFAGKATGPLGKRAAKQDQGILVIRFEAPYPFYCSGCNHMIDQGVRFNAEKRQIGKYYSTKIWGFTMKAPCCSNAIEIHTDPKSTQYILVRGGKRKTTQEMAEAVVGEGTAELAPEEETARLREDPFYRLEHTQAEQKRAKERRPELTRLYEKSEETTLRDYEANKALRRGLRAQRKEGRALTAEGAALGLPSHIPLLGRADADADAAAAVSFRGGFEGDRKRKRAEIRTGSIFAHRTATAAAGASRRPASQADKAAKLLQRQRSAGSAVLGARR